jgi:hypothetical protein
MYLYKGYQITLEDLFDDLEGGYFYRKYRNSSKKKEKEIK